MSKEARPPVPAHIQQALRAEVNFGCPVRFPDGSGCGSPVLEYHHFPSWAESRVHDPEQMIALCPEHHGRADGGGFTARQLSEFKKNPFVDEPLRVRWPFDLEGLVCKIGPSLVLGSGAPLRLGGIPVLAFEPEDIAAFGTRTVRFTSTVPARDGSAWLSIRDGTFEATLSQTRDLVFTPQHRRFSARGNDSTRLDLAFRRVGRKRIPEWADGFLRQSSEQRAKRSRSELLDLLGDHIDRLNLVDSDGNVPVFEFSGKFFTSEATVLATRDRLCTDIHVKGNEGSVEWHTHFVGQESRMAIRLAGGTEFLSLG